MTHNDGTATQREKLSPAWLLFMGTLAASIGLSIVSAYETYLGLLDFMPDGATGHVLSTILTFGVQVLLFAISWSIAQHLRDEFWNLAPRVLIWIICAFFSGYFSFYGFLEGTGGRNEDVRQQEVRAEIDDIFLKIGEGFDLKIDNGHRTFLNDPAYETWKDGSIGKLISIASTAESEIEQAARRDAQVIRQEILAANDRLVPLEDALRVARTNVSITGDNLARLQAEVETLIRAVSEIEQSTVQQEAVVEGFADQLEEEAKTGVGPRYREIQIDLNSERSKLANLQTRKERIEARLQITTERRNRLELEQEDGLEDKRKNDLESRIDAEQAEIVRLEESLAEKLRGVEFNFDKQESRYNALKADLEKRDYAKYDALVELCSEIKAQLSPTSLRESVEQISCSSAELANSVGALRELLQGKTAFQTECVDMQPALGFDPSQGRAGFWIVNPLIDHVNSCVQQERDQNLRATLQARLSSLKTRRGDNAEPITMGSVALFADQQGNAVMSAIFAIIVDLLVLLCALVGRNVGLPEDARAIDAIIRNARTPDPAIEGVERTLNLLEIDPGRMTMMSGILDRLLRDNMAEYDPSGEDQLRLKTGALAHLKALRKSVIRDNLEAVAQGEPNRLDHAGARTPRRGASQHPRRSL